MKKKARFQTSIFDGAGHKEKGTFRNKETDGMVVLDEKDFPNLTMLHNQVGHCVCVLNKQQNARVP